jgi:hypothetical protein
MAKFELKFLSNDDPEFNISVEADKSQIVITTEDSNQDSITICLDKSTAIKFAKTLRTEINKITEREVSNG